MSACPDCTFTRHRLAPPTVSIADLHRPVLDASPRLGWRVGFAAALGAALFAALAWLSG